MLFIITVCLSVVIFPTIFIIIILYRLFRRMHLLDPVFELGAPPKVPPPEAPPPEAPPPFVTSPVFPSRDVTLASGSIWR